MAAYLAQAGVKSHRRRTNWQPRKYRRQHTTPHSDLASSKATDTQDRGESEVMIAVSVESCDSVERPALMTDGDRAADRSSDEQAMPAQRPADKRIKEATASMRGGIVRA